MAKPTGWKNKTCLTMGKISIPVRRGKRTYYIFAKSYFEKRLKFRRTGFYSKAIYWHCFRDGNFFAIIWTTEKGEENHVGAKNFGEALEKILSEELPIYVAYELYLYKKRAETEVYKALPRYSMEDMPHYQCDTAMRPRLQK